MQVCSLARLLEQTVPDHRQGLQNKSACIAAEVLVNLPQVEPIKLQMLHAVH